MLPAIKVYDMDYSFLIKNYLNPELWHKTWTLFEYKDFRVTLNIYSIQTKSDKIMLDITVHKRNIESYTGDDSIEKTAVISLKVDNINIIKRQINSTIFDAMRTLERNYLIRKTEAFAALDDSKYEEKNKLRAYAEEFLDSNNVTNRNLREAYIEAYIDEYAKFPELMSKYIEDNTYRLCSDFYLVWLSTVQDDPECYSRTQMVKDALSDDEYRKTVDEILEYQKYMQTVSFETEMKDNLEVI